MLRQASRVIPLKKASALLLGALTFLSFLQEEVGWWIITRPARTAASKKQAVSRLLDALGEQVPVSELPQVIPLYVPTANVGESYFRAFTEACENLMTQGECINRLYSLLVMMQA